MPSCASHRPRWGTYLQCIVNLQRCRDTRMTAGDGIFARTTALTKPNHRHRTLSLVTSHVSVRSFATELDGRKSDEVPYAAEAEANSEGKLLPAVFAMRPLCSPMCLSRIALRRPKTMPIHELERDMRCKDCRISANERSAVNVPGER